MRPNASRAPVDNSSLGNLCKPPYIHMPIHIPCVRSPRDWAAIPPTPLSPYRTNSHTPKSHRHLKANPSHYFCLTIEPSQDDKDQAVADTDEAVQKQQMTALQA